MEPNSGHHHTGIAFECFVPKDRAGYISQQNSRFLPGTERKEQERHTQIKTTGHQCRKENDPHFCCQKY